MPSQTQKTYIRIKEISSYKGRKEKKFTSYCSPEDSAGGTEVVRATRGVGVHTLAQESKILHWKIGHLQCYISSIKMLPKALG